MNTGGQDNNLEFVISAVDDSGPGLQSSGQNVDALKAKVATLKLEITALRGEMAALAATESKSIETVQQDAALKD